ncbi:glycosyl hydrolase family 61-domain-containing protein [Dichomitus squalens]|uniref:lytic cellulose monooxygenase (C4-dehydrogenating) n=1 Tax=Dichomitus squalens TaxID=114155 RepID=A0A4Q9Q0Z7_9APHY|nr:glycosyl hydrolase family 61-domain-containing protein [Dichomitus squalens]TBU60214.1 glycosyl hydrolase family 61-domain-containing protein [Dichomitus squalens]
MSMGKAYQGNALNSKSVQSPIRMINSVSPVQNMSSSDLSCGQSAQKAAKSPHEAGPLMTYMASCGSAGCANFDSSFARWFEIEESGFRSDGTWAMKSLFGGLPANLVLPSNIAPGGYLIHHEIPALQKAQTEGGADLYPSCAQLRVGGSQFWEPQLTTSFPGAYSTDSGILVNVYPLTGQYEFTGPAVSNLEGMTLAALATNETAAVDSPSGRVSRVMHALQESAVLLTFLHPPLLTFLRLPSSLLPRHYLLSPYSHSLRI